MKKLFLFISLTLVFTTGYSQLDRSVKPPPGPAPEIRIGEYETFQLKNGLTVIVVENPKLPRVSFSLIVDRDPLMEGDKVGYVSMAGEMLRRGTSNRTKEELDEAVDFIGATLATGSNSIYASSLSRHTDVLLDLMTDVLYHPVFPEEELGKVKKQTLSGIASQKDDPEAIAEKVTRVVMYSKDHPYGEIQLKEHVDRIQRQDLVNYYETYFKPNISYLAIVGDITSKEAKKLARKYFEDWEEGDVPEHSYEIPEAPSTSEVALVDRSASVQTVLDLSNPIILEKGHPDVVKASVMNEILGGSSASRLFKNIREDKGYTYGAYSYISSDELVGEFGAGASVRNEVTDSALTEFMFEFNRIVEEIVSEEELRRAKNVLIGRFGRSLESPQTVAAFAINIERYDLPEDYYDTYVKKVEAVSPADVQEMAGKYIMPRQMHIVAVGKGKEIEDRLKSFGEITYYDPYGNVLDPAAASLPAGMNAATVMDRHIEAIGGRERLEKVEDIRIEMAADVMGNPLQILMRKKSPDMMNVEVKMGSNVMSQQIYDGEQARIVQMGNEVPAGEEMKQRMELESAIFPELHYAENQVGMELTGVENVNGREAYVMEVVYPYGRTTTFYFDTESWYKIRQVQRENSPQGEMTLVTDFSDFREKDGIVFPWSIKMPVSPAMQMNAEVQSIDLNTGLDEKIFEVE